jgi:AraC-like DNA-binding protein
MSRATDVQKALRLNQARDLLRERAPLPAAAEHLAQACAISPRQAYRYLQAAQQLTAPVPVDEAKLAFTVKLPRSLIQRVRGYATATGASISDVVGRALLAFLAQRHHRG